MKIKIDVKKFNSIEFYEVLSVYNAYDPLNRYPDLSTKSYDLETILLFTSLGEKKFYEEELLKEIEETHLNLFGGDLNEGLKLLLRDETYEYLHEKYVLKHKAVNLGKILKELDNTIDKIKNDLPLKLNYLRNVQKK